jgi:hypothetical protein
MDATRHILLRDRRDWLGARSGLAVDRDGVLTLARVPAPADGKPIAIASSSSTACARPARGSAG